MCLFVNLLCTSADDFLFESDVRVHNIVRQKVLFEIGTLLFSSYMPLLQ